MGLFGRIFGSSETNEQRLERARVAMSDNEPDLALRILARVDGAEAAELMELARDKIRGRDATLAPDPASGAIRDMAHVLFGNHWLLGTDPTKDAGASVARVHSEGGMTFSFGADGSQSIHTSAGPVVLNKPRSDDDGRKRSRDGLAVARQLIDLSAAAEGELETPAFPFIDAALLVARAGEQLPMMKDARRRRLAAMCKAAAVRDHELVMSLARHDVELTSYVVPLVLPFAPLALATFGPYNAMVHRAVAAADREAGEAMYARVPDDMVGEALLVAIDCSLDREPVRARWDGLAKTGGESWEAFELRHLARTDLDVAFGRELARDSHDDDASLAVAARLAQVDPDRALARAHQLGPDCYHQSWLLGCVRGAGAQTTDLVDAWIEHLSHHTYHPYGFFRVVLECCLRLGDAERVERLCERGGPTGWQIAHAARWDLGRSPNRTELLEALLARYRPGCVSARGRERTGLTTVGMCVTRPAWLELEAPHPIETLSIVAALGADGPAWSDDALP